MTGARLKKNDSFYTLPAAPVFEHWTARVPKHFVPLVKGNRFFTHVKKLNPSKEVLQLAANIYSLRYKKCRKLFKDSYDADTEYQMPRKNG